MDVADIAAAFIWASGVIIGIAITVLVIGIAAAILLTENR